LFRIESAEARPAGQPRRAWYFASAEASSRWMPRRVATRMNLFGARVCTPLGIRGQAEFIELELAKTALTSP